MSDKPTFADGVKAVSDSFQYLLDRCNERAVKCFCKQHSGYHELREDCAECREQMEQDQRRLYDLEDRANHDSEI